MGTRVMIIGSNNVFEVDCVSYALKIGDSNNLEAKSVVGKSTVLTNGCIVGAGCEAMTEEILPENCVIYGSRNDRRIQGDRPGPQKVNKTCINMSALLLYIRQYMSSHASRSCT